MLRKAFNGLLADYSFLIISNIINLVSVPFILSFIGKEAYGIQGTLFQILSYFNLLELGVGVYLVKIYQVKIKDGEVEKLNKLLSTIFYLFFIISVIVIVLAVIFLLFFLDDVIKSHVYINETKYTFLIAVVWTALSIPLGIYNTILHAQQRLALVKSLMGLQAILNTILILALLLLGLKLISFAIAYGVSGAIITLVYYYYVNNSSIEINLNRSLIDFSMVKDILAFSWNFSSAKLSNVIKNSSDLIFITIYFSLSDVTEFMLTGKLFMLVIMFAQRVPLALFPGFGELYAYNNFSKISNYFHLLSFYSIRLAIIIGLLIVIFNEYFVTIWVGRSNFAGQILNYTFFFYFLKEIYFNSIGFILYSYGELKHLNIVSIMEVILKIVFIVILTKYLKTESIIIAGILAGLLTTMFFYPIKICKSINLDLKLYFVKSILGPILLSLPVILTYLLILYLNISLKNIFNLFIITTILIFVNIISFDKNYLSKKLKEVFFAK